ncbi:MAG TPA: GNAT family N-acetyltransferase [Steroidobacteraceae bacterium]|jgi:GNAT superfamily N-acetyltransferase|nr:GNAT family N-acetyltransferase [Steroidobacteraceae bacterium]
MAKRVSLRLGMVGDLATLVDIDADAGTLFEESGLFLDLPDDHEFPVSERRCWQECLAARTTLIAADKSLGSIAFAAVGRKDGAAYLAQIAVRRYFMGLGIGGALLEAAAEIAAASGLQEFWLTTYDHLAWNRPFYERHGFVVMPDSACGPELQEVRAMERKWLPLPDQRVVMRRSLR